MKKSLFTLLILLVCGFLAAQFVVWRNGEIIFQTSINKVDSITLYELDLPDTPDDPDDPDDPDNPDDPDDPDNPDDPDDPDNPDNPDDPDDPDNPDDPDDPDNPDDPDDPDNPDDPDDPDNPDNPDDPDSFLPKVDAPEVGKTTVVLYVPEDTPEGCYAVGTVNSWAERDTQLKFDIVKGADSKRWVSYTFDYDVDMQIKVLAIPSDPAVAPSWSYQWGKNMDPENDLQDDNVVILQGDGELVLENQGQPKLTTLADGGVVFIEIKSWARTPVIEAKVAETAAIKHPWNGGDWTYQEMTKVTEGTFEYIGRFAGVGVNIAMDVNGTNEHWYPMEQFTFIDEIEVGDLVKFTFVSEKLTIGQVYVELVEKAIDSNCYLYQYQSELNEVGETIYIFEFSTGGLNLKNVEGTGDYFVLMLCAQPREDGFPAEKTYEYVSFDDLSANDNWEDCVIGAYLLNESNPIGTFVYVVEDGQAVDVLLCVGGNVRVEGGVANGTIIANLEFESVVNGNVVTKEYIYTGRFNGEEPEEPKEITVKAKVPAHWDDVITAWVWPTGGEGHEVYPIKEGDWYVVTEYCTEMNIIFKNGFGWNGDANQTVDITGITENTCFELYQEGYDMATATAVDCEKGEEVKPWDAVNFYDAVLWNLCEDEYGNVCEYPFRGYILEENGDTTWVTDVNEDGVDDVVRECHLYVFSKGIYTDYQTLVGEDDYLMVVTTASIYDGKYYYCIGDYEFSDDESDYKKEYEGRKYMRSGYATYTHFKPESYCKYYENVFAAQNNGVQWPSTQEELDQFEAEYGYWLGEQDSYLYYFVNDPEQPYLSLAGLVVGGDGFDWAIKDEATGATYLSYMNLDFAFFDNTAMGFATELDEESGNLNFKVPFEMAPYYERTISFGTKPQSAPAKNGQKGMPVLKGKVSEKQMLVNRAMNIAIKCAMK